MIELREYQKRTVEKLLEILSRRGVALDASDTGVGKTYVACEVIRRLEERALVICPKSVIWKWEELLDAFGIGDWCEVMTLQKLLYKGRRIGVYDIVNRFGILVWDECHRGQASYTTHTVRIMGRLKGVVKYILLLSATALANPLKMRATASLLGICDYRDYFRWIHTVGCVKKYFGGYEFKDVYKMHKIFEDVFNSGDVKGVRVRVKDIPDEFPDNEVEVEAYDMSEGDIMKINLLYDSVGSLGELINVRAQVEEIKARYICEDADELILEGRRPVCFLTFLGAINILKKSLEERGRYVGVITGNTTDREREEIVKMFHGDELDCVVCQISVGGVGLSFHDVRGEFPRVSLISPDFSAINLLQAMGRIYRNGARSKCLHRIYYVPGGVEENIGRNLRSKLLSISIGNDGVVDNDLIGAFNDMIRERRLG